MYENVYRAAIDPAQRGAFGPEAEAEAEARSKLFILSSSFYTGVLPCRGAVSLMRKGYPYALE